MRKRNLSLDANTINNKSYSTAKLNKTSKSLEMGKINELVDLHRLKKYKLEQLKKNVFNELGFTFMPKILDTNKYKINNTFEERNYTSFYPNRLTIINKKKFYNKENNSSNPNISKITNKLNRENSFNSKNSFINNSNINSIQNSNMKSKRDKNIENIINSPIVHKNEINNSLNINSNNSVYNKLNNHQNISKSKKSSICNFSTTKIPLNLNDDKISNLENSKQDLNENKKQTKIKESKNAFQKMNVKINKDIELLDYTMEANDIISYSSNKKQNDFTENKNKNTSINFNSGTPLIKNNLNKKREENQILKRNNSAKKINYEQNINVENKNNNYGNIYYPNNKNCNGLFDEKIEKKKMINNQENDISINKSENQNNFSSEQNESFGNYSLK